MHLSPDFRRGEDWAVTASNTFSPSSPPLTPELPSAYATSSTSIFPSNGSFSDSDHSHYATGSNPSPGQTPRGSWLPQLDFRILPSLQDSSYQPAQTQACLAPHLSSPHQRFEDLTLVDIEALEEVQGSSGRRQSSTYRFGQDQVIKVSPHRNILYEARVLAYIQQHLPSIPVPRVLGVRQLRDAVGRGRVCMLLEYIDGVRADEAVCDWNAEETQAFVDAVQALRTTLAATTGPCIQAIRISMDGDCDMSDGDMAADNGQPDPEVNVHDEAHVQDELFDHIWQAMERGPFATEAAFLASIGVALRRRGAGAARLDLVSRMIDQLPSSTASAGPRVPGSAPAPFPLQHANLTLGNLLVRRTAQSSAPEIVGVLGWGQSGFYPPWWEMAKMAASEDKLLVDLAARDPVFQWYSQHASVMLHVRDIIY